MTCGDNFREALTRPWPLPLSIPAVTAVAAAAAASPLPLRYPGFSSPFSRPRRQQRRRPWWVENLAVIVVAILAVVVPPIPDLVVFVTRTRDRSRSRRDGRKRTTQTPNERYRGPAVVVPPAAAEVVVDLRRLPPGFRLQAGVPRRRRADEGVEPVSQGDGGVRVPGPVEEVPLASERRRLLRLARILPRERPLLGLAQPHVPGEFPVLEEEERVREGLEVVEFRLSLCFCEEERG